MKPKKVLIIGSGGLKIGQAGEFDYSGSQALKALAEEGIERILINPNIATVQTNENMSDKVYYLPIEPYFVEQIIVKEKIDALLLSFGGQTALNCGLKLDELGILEKYKVKILGTPLQSIRETEDRHLFKAKLEEIGIVTAKSRAVYSTQEALHTASEIGYPVMMRTGFALGGKGSGIVNNEDECRELAQISFSSVSQILIEECLYGWKEVEYEIVRDSANNCISVCNMENFDPIGVHTGESIVVAPSQTLDNYDYQKLRNIAIKTICHLGIIGECNIQFALDPCSRSYCVIEVNARLSRSSALASKATGYPLAYVAAKIALGYKLIDIPNGMVERVTAFFEPALDYIVCKFPRWDLDKFQNANQHIGTEMKSVGEVMSIGRCFAEVIQKAIRMLDIGAEGLFWEKNFCSDIRDVLKNPTPKRIFAIVQAFQKGITVQEIYDLTKIDRFFLREIERAVCLERLANSLTLEDMSKDYLISFKKSGFSDKTLAKILKVDETTIYNLRRHYGVVPALAQIDTLAAEYPSNTNYLYFTYHQYKSDITPNKFKKRILVLGSGCYRIGSSVEFDWCAVSAVQALRKSGYDVILINCNPETVSTDYDICEYLIFDEITFETVLELYEYMCPIGVIVAMGGQTANNLALKLNKANIPILGTSAISIDTAEDRYKFSCLLDKINIKQPCWIEVKSNENLEQNTRFIGGFPILVRPSYVLSGSAMRVAENIIDLTSYIQNATIISSEHPVTISKYEIGAREVEVDAVVYQGEVKLFAIFEHVESAGVHSGDANLVLPTFSLSSNILMEIEEVTRRISRELKVTGPCNIQFLVKNNEIKVIECNLRASRSFPFVSKTLGINFIHEAIFCMLDLNVTSSSSLQACRPLYYAVKSPQFSFGRLKGVDPRCSVEMSSTGEVACFGSTLEEALLLANIAAGFKYPFKGIIFDLESEIKNTSEYQILIQSLIYLCEKLSLVLYVTPLTAKLLKNQSSVIFKIIDIESYLSQGVESLIEFLKSDTIDWVVSIPLLNSYFGCKYGYFLRRFAVELELNLTTDYSLFINLVKALLSINIENYSILSLNDFTANYTKNKNEFINSSESFLHEYTFVEPDSNKYNLFK